MPWWGWIIVGFGGPVAILIVWFLGVVFLQEAFEMPQTISLWWPISLPLIALLRAWESAKEISHRPKVLAWAKK